MNTPRENNTIPLGEFPSSGSGMGEDRSAPPPLTGGSGRTRGEKRTLPDVEIPENVPASYAQLLAQGLDSYQEAINLKVPPVLTEQFEQWQLAAKALDPRKGQAITVSLGGEDLQSWPCGSKGGVRWVHEGPEFMLFWRNPEHDWCLSVRYTSVGLWHYGLDALRERVYAMLHAAGCVISTTDKNRVSRADWAFDFYAPRFASEMCHSIIPNIVMHSSVTGNFFFKGGGRGLTLTMGKTSSTLQIQIYEKTEEIKEASGKDWMIDLWLRNGWMPEDGEIKNVWRLEVRMGGDWLKDREANMPDTFNNCLNELVTEALLTHRLTEPSEYDSNRRRWRLHPLYALAYHSIGSDFMRPLGHYTSGAREVLLERLKRQIAVTMRSGLILATGNHKPEDAEILAADAVKLMLCDPEAERKAEAARERYKYVEEAR